MRKTKIICTLGPSTDKDGVLEELIKEGMNVARFNFSHGLHDEQKGRINKLKEIRTRLNKPVAALLDTKGPEIRICEFADGKIIFVLRIQIPPTFPKKYTFILTHNFHCTS